MDKIITLAGRSDKGVFSFVIDQERQYLEKTASQYHPTIASYINSARPIPGRTQVLLTALGAGEYWGCFLEGAPVLLADGKEKPIDQMEPGDQVWSHANRPCSVIAPMGRYYEGEVYKFGFRSWGESLQCTEEHPIYGVKLAAVKQARAKYYKQDEAYEAFIAKVPYSFNPAKEYSVGDYVCVPFVSKTVSNPALDREGWAFLMGWYLAEGCLVKRYDKPGHPWTKIIWTLSSSEGDIALKIKDICASYNHNVQITEGYQGNKVIRVEAQWSEFAQTCFDYLGRGERGKYLSTDVLAMPTEWQRDFLSAYLQGDGCQVKTKGRYYGSLVSSTASRKLAVDLLKLTARFGYAGSFLKRQQGAGGYGAGNTIYCNSYARTLSTEINAECYESVASERRSGMSCYVDRERGYILVPINKVESSEYCGDVFNIEVEGDNSYCVNSFAVHNCNANGDYFPESALAHEGPDFGYKTFEHHARVFQHHINRVDSKSYGTVLLSVYNPVFHRVELIVSLDNQAAPDLVAKHESGEQVSWSMGCRIRFDICNICGNKAPTRAQYCDHARYHLGEIDPQSGKQIYVINTMPCFFDISYVFIGADRIAKSLLKVASVAPGSQARIIGSAEAAEKMAATLKAATIVKEVPASGPPGSSQLAVDLAKAVMEVKALEEPLPRPVMQRLEQAPLKRVMATLTALGILPKPQEFQRLVLVAIGRHEMADELDQRNECFDPASDVGEPNGIEAALGLSGKNFDPDLMETLAPHMAARSYASPHLGRRLSSMTKKASGKAGLPTLLKVGHDGLRDHKIPNVLPVLGLTAAMYRTLEKRASSEALLGIDRLIADHPRLATVLGLTLLTMFRHGVQVGSDSKTMGNFTPGQRYEDPDVTNVFSRIEQLKQKPYMKVATDCGRSAPSATAKGLYLGMPGVFMASGSLQKQRENSPRDDEKRAAHFVRTHPDVMSGLCAADALLAKEAGGLHKVAAAADYLDDSAFSKVRMLSTAAAGALFDQAALETSLRILRG